MDILQLVADIAPNLIGFALAALVLRDEVRNLRQTIEAQDKRYHELVNTLLDKDRVTVGQAARLHRDSKD